MLHSNSHASGVQILFGLVRLHKGEPMQGLDSHTLHFAFLLNGAVLLQKKIFVSLLSQDIFEENDEMRSLGSEIRRLFRKTHSSDLWVSNGFRLSSKKGLKSNEIKLVETVMVVEPDLCKFLRKWLPKLEAGARHLHFTSQEAY